MIYMNIYIPLLFLYHEIKNMKECTKEVLIMQMKNLFVIKDI